jgi:hypothetical protein
VLENTAAQPRAFVVPSARVAQSLGTALSEMVHRPFAPTREVVLSADPGAWGTDRGGQGTARVTSYGPNEVTVHSSTTGPAWLVLSDTYYPGWRATIDGQPAPVLRGDVLFRVVPVPGGEHDVHFRFAPMSIEVGAAISLASLACLLVAFGLAAKWRRAPSSTAI